MWFFLASLVLLYLPTRCNLEHSLFSRSSSLFFNFGILRRWYSRSSQLNPPLDTFTATTAFLSRLSNTLVLLPTLHSVFGRFCLYALH
ncbi:uncharacterized protein EDB91DRAFT_1177425 [Suillus paluster]|uniref:uncharacterized protein n=1 Tax=Suillus paluster TaxID=48578 RepID=UPI001B87BE41|nr:uncharacterized protein EDB91DRAFT_1177425 [Suillus paluster]KAG1720714.1 hypothetical protein EDB91DRAFT_1177425 [Suillus paluster]